MMRQIQRGGGLQRRTFYCYLQPKPGLNSPNQLALCCFVCCSLLVARSRRRRRRRCQWKLIDYGWRWPYDALLRPIIVIIQTSWIIVARVLVCCSSTCLCSLFFCFLLLVEGSHAWTGDRIKRNCCCWLNCCWWRCCLGNEWRDSLNLL